MRTTAVWWTTGSADSNDNTALPKSGDHSVGVARQYCGALGKLANCQSLVTLTLADGRVLVPLAMRLFLPRVWTDDPQRCQAAGVPSARLAFCSKGQLALEEVDRVRALGVSFRIVLADAGYGTSKDFRQALSQRGLRWAVGIEGHQNAYSVQVQCTPPQQVTRGRPQKYAVPSEPPRPVKDVLGEQPRNGWWRVKGGRLSRWMFARVRIADGVGNAWGIHLPGEAVWVVGEWRPNGQVKYYATNHPVGTSKTRIVKDLKARWQCETMHTQAKEELGLDHFEGRSYRGLIHHVALVMLAMVFLQTLRQGMTNEPSEAGEWTLPQTRRAFTRLLEQRRFWRCPHCGERIAA